MKCPRPIDDIANIMVENLKFNNGMVVEEDDGIDVLTEGLKEAGYIDEDDETNGINTETGDEETESKGKMEVAIEGVNIDPDGYSQIVLFEDGNILFVQGEKMLDIDRVRFQFHLQFGSSFKTREATRIEQAIHKHIFGN